MWSQTRPTVTITSRPTIRAATGTTLRRATSRLVTTCQRTKAREPPSIGGRGRRLNTPTTMLSWIRMAMKTAHWLLATAWPARRGRTRPPVGGRARRVGPAVPRGAPPPPPAAPASAEGPRPGGAHAVGEAADEPAEAL